MASLLVDTVLDFLVLHCKPCQPAARKALLYPDFMWVGSIDILCKSQSSQFEH